MAYPWQEAPVRSWRATPGFWADRLDAYRRVTLPHVLTYLDSEGRLSNFRRAAGLESGPFRGQYSFDDSDVYKVLEGMAYSLELSPDGALDRQTDAIIDLVARAQMTDGYLFTWHQLKDPRRRWTDMNSHEMYCGGHLMEAAAAHHAATGKDNLLNVARRLGDHYRDVFGPGRRHWVDGHEEVGLGLVRLSEATGDPAYRQFEYWHLEERGHGHGHGHVWDLEGFGARYSQDHLPVRDIVDAEGHSVRAMYLYGAMTDLAALDGISEYEASVKRAWSSVVERKMYVTGGIGAEGRFEGFGPDYYLPNRDAYCETCAAIAMVYWNHRMNLLTGEARYADVIERELYNGALAGISLSGDRFFYVNPLESRGHHHRRPWFGCSCCPSNVARFVPSLPHYLFATGPGTVVVNQYAAGDATLSVDGRAVHVRVDTGYPWEGGARITVEADGPGALTVLLRQPSWANGAVVSQNGRTVDGLVLKNGYWPVAVEHGGAIAIQWRMGVERVHAAPEVEADRGRMAIQRGPVVYCMEETDHVDMQADPLIRPEVALEPETRDDWHGFTVLTGELDYGRALTAVPYFAWDNREPGWMRVWLREV